MIHLRNVLCVAASLLICPVSAADRDAAGQAQQEASARKRAPIVVTGDAIRIHQSAPVFDGHNDLPWALRKSGGVVGKIDLRKNQPELHTDIPRLRAGGVGAQFWSVYVPVSTTSQNNALTATLEQIAVVRELTKQYSDVFELALTTKDVKRISGEGKIASLIGVEGGHSIENSINVLRQLFREGARYMTLTHSMSLDWADSCSDDSISGGLSAFGEEIIHEMNRLGMIVDLSHVSPACMKKALEITEAPVIFSHSSARAVADHHRNVPDNVLLLTKKNGGVVMVNFFSDYVYPVDATRSLNRAARREKFGELYPEDEEKAKSALRQWELKNPRSGQCTVHDLLDHIDHIVRVAGIDHVGLGSDYDGVPALPAQLEDVSTYPVITQGLLDRGYAESSIRKILGGNVMRVFEQVEQVSSKLSQEK
ncbi:dipeptidase [bacterium]|nr:dipeptidase [bacterium]MDB4476799.1 dipeptidase [Rhodopirellula sp.]MDB4540620.1 dipeptidase [bacterium]